MVPIVTHMNNPPGMTRVLLVDDDDVVRATLSTLLAMSGFEITTAASVHDALKLICSETYDVLLSDLHMPGAGDGLTVISAMRHANPRTITVLLSAFPQMSAATHALVSQADEILLKPFDIQSLVKVIRHRVAGGPETIRETLSVARFLSENTGSITQRWLDSIQRNDALSLVNLTCEQRCSHLPPLFLELVERLHTGEGNRASQISSQAATLHGDRRFRQGYSASMLTEEFRVFQASIFQILKKNLERLNVSDVFADIMIIADEMNAQLSDALTGFLECAVDNNILDQVSVYQVVGVNLNWTEGLVAHSQAGPAMNPPCPDPVV